MLAHFASCLDYTHIPTDAMANLTCGTPCGFSHGNCGQVLQAHKFCFKAGYTCACMLLVQAKRFCKVMLKAYRF